MLGLEADAVGCKVEVIISAGLHVLVELIRSSDVFECLAVERGQAFLQLNEALLHVLFSTQLIQLDDIGSEAFGVTETLFDLVSPTESVVLFHTVGEYIGPLCLLLVVHL